MTTGALPGTTPAPTPMLEVRDIAITFRGVHALDGVSFAVAQGGITAVIGPNGAGKTTLFNCVSGIYRYGGKILLDGRDLTGLRPAERARCGLARTFQTPTLVDAKTVLDNVLLGGHGRTRGGMAASALRLPHVRRDEEELREQGLTLLARLELERLAATRVGQLPHGLRRRVEIARALLSHPRLLMLDEPAAGVGHTEAAALGRLLLELAEEAEVTFLLVEHDVALVLSVARQVVVLDFGRILADGAPSVVRRDPAVVAAYLGEAS